MRGLVEYTIAKSELWQLILRTQEDLTEKLSPGVSRAQAVRSAETIANIYYKEFQEVLDSGLANVATNAINEYRQEVGLTLDSDQDEADEIENLVNRLMKSNHKDKYFGASLDERLLRGKASMFERIKKASVWGSEFGGLKNFFSKPVPYGSQFNIDNRILLAQASKIEQDAARTVAKDAGANLIKWSLSPAHPKPDICDDLANAVDPEVVRYIEENKLRLSPKGVYFVDEMPYPPHPNCMCEYAIVTPERTAERVRKRTSKALSRALKALRRK